MTLKDIRCPNCKRLLLKMEGGAVSIMCKPCKQIWNFGKEAPTATAVS